MLVSQQAWLSGKYSVMIVAEGIALWSSFLPPFIPSKLNCSVLDIVLKMQIWTSQIQPHLLRGLNYCGEWEVDWGDQVSKVMR